MGVDKAKLDAVKKKTKAVVDAKFVVNDMASEINKIIENAYGKGKEVPSKEREELAKLIKTKFKV